MPVSHRFTASRARLPQRRKPAAALNWKRSALAQRAGLLTSRPRCAEEATARGREDATASGPGAGAAAERGARGSFRMDG